MNTIMIKILAIAVYCFCIIYGFKGLMAEIHKEDKSYFMSLGVGEQKPQQIPIRNIIAGSLFLLCGIVGIIVTLLELAGVKVIS